MNILVIQELVGLALTLYISSLKMQGKTEEEIRKMVDEEYDKSLKRNPDDLPDA